MCRDHDQGRDDDDDDDDDDMGNEALVAGSCQNTIVDLPRYFHQLRLNNNFNFDVLSHLCVYLRKRLFSFVSFSSSSPDLYFRLQFIDTQMEKEAMSQVSQARQVHMTLPKLMVRTLTPQFFFHLQIRMYPRVIFIVFIIML